MPTTRDTPALSAGRYGIELDGRFAGWASSAAGGEAYGVLAELGTVPGRASAKRIAAVKYEDIEIRFGSDMGADFYGWIEQALAQRPARRNGAILSLDARGQVVSRLEFLDGSVSGIFFPSLNAVAKEPAELSVKIAPSRTKRRQAGEADSAVPLPSAPAPVRKKLMRSNFRLRIDGLDCSKVSGVGELAVRTDAGQQDLSNLSIVLPEAAAPPFHSWQEEFLVQGEGSPEGEKAATLELLSADLQSALVTLTLGGLGVFRLAAIPSGHGEELRRVRAEMYCRTLGVKHVF